MTDGSTADKVEDILTCVTTLTGAGICIYDLEELFSGERAVVRALRGHYCDFCYQLRALPGGKPACIKSDVEDAVSIAKEYHSSFFHTCHIGLTELVLPIFLEEKLIAAVFIGQCRIDGETKPDIIYQNVKKFGMGRGQFDSLFTSLPLCSRHKLHSAGRLAESAFQNLIREGGYDSLQAYFDSGDSITQAIRYVENHYLEELSTHMVAEQVHLNPSYLARQFKYRLGYGITEYIRILRMKRAKELLHRTSLPVRVIAENAGYPDQAYFTRCFTRQVGCSPASFRQKIREEKRNTK